TTHRPAQLQALDAGHGHDVAGQDRPAVNGQVGGQGAGGAGPPVDDGSPSHRRFLHTTTRRTARRIALPHRAGTRPRSPAGARRGAADPRASHPAPAAVPAWRRSSPHAERAQLGAHTATEARAASASTDRTCGGVHQATTRPATWAAVRTSASTAPGSVDA